MNCSNVSLGDRLVISALTQRHVAFAINRLFKLGVEPIPMTSERIKESYETMIETSKMYNEKKGNLSFWTKRNVRLTELELLRIIEFEATHFVCKRSSKPLILLQSREYFLEQLYAHPEKYCFFQPRDQAIRAYSSFGWLQLEDFVR
ncbi:hypothetical protein HY483_01980 [Candidatus Woesearchaeota archaeon]|nr:hypothetical protein [Candidatus Woesearchaeota archaeon]